MSTHLTTTDVAGIPASLRAFAAGLAGAQPDPADTPAPAAAVTDYAYGWLPRDASYSTPQYPTSGTFAGTVTPWLNDLAAVPKSWTWADADTAASGERGKDAQTQTASMQPPGPPPTGTTAQQILSRFMTGMWDSAIFPKADLAPLTAWIDDDAEFARQRLGGANPNVIASATTFPVTAWIDAAANAAALGTLKQQLVTLQQSGRLFCCDYRPVLAGVTTRTGAQLAAPVAMFAVNGQALVPLAIQIDGEHGASYIFTPKDPLDPQGDAWLLAKLWVGNADLTWWFSGTHLFNTHTIDMTFGIGAVKLVQQNVLSEKHPMLILARPHLVKSFDINSLVYDRNSSPGGLYAAGEFADKVLPTGRIGIYEIIDRLFAHYSFGDQAFDAAMAARGLASDPMTQVTFPYRDDAGLWWTAIRDFVTAIVNATYPTDQDVASDAALGAWMGAVEAAFNHDGTVRWTWASNGTSATKADAVHTFTNLLFLCSAQHCAVNDPMFNAWGFTPNGPFNMQQPPPVDAASVTQQLVLDTLPDPRQTGQEGSSGPPQTDLTAIQSQVTFVMLGTPRIPGDAVVGEWLAGSTSEPLSATYVYAAGSRQEAAVAAFETAVNGPNGVALQLQQQLKRRVAAFGPSTPVPYSVTYPYLAARLVPTSVVNAPATVAIQV